jgi:opine dehydrogenase
LLNAGRIEYSKGEFYLYREGMTPSVLRADQYLSDEMIAVGKGYASEVRHFGGASVLEAIGPVCGDDAVDKRIGSTKGPSSLNNRYFTEDIPFGLFGASQLAKKAGVETPVTDATITLGQIVCQIDVHKIGATLESMGLAELSREEIINLVQRGHN